MIISKYLNLDDDYDYYDYDNYSELLQPGWSSSATQDPEWPAQIRSAVDLFKLGVTSITLWTNFVANFGQKSDFIGLCGIGNWGVEYQNIPDICHFFYTGKIFGE